MKLSLLFTLGLMVSTAEASISLVTNGPGCTQVGNLVVNGSFENGAPGNGSANWKYWATGTINTPFASIPGWNTSGPANNYAVWGNDNSNPQRLTSSGDLPDGNFAVYMGNGTGATVDQQPVFQPDGSVTFASTPTFGPKYGAPVVLSQTINTPANPAASYEMCFWVSGEMANGAFAGLAPGIMALAVTNVTTGSPLIYLAVPNGINGNPASAVYEFNFTPLNPNLPVQINLINWGHVDLSTYGGPFLTAEPVIDNVIINAIVPEPSSIALFSVFSTFVLLKKPRLLR